MSRRDVEFDSDGVRCAAWLYEPSGSGPHPCVVMAHGFSGVREQRLDAYAERFTAAGLACLLFDYRHFGASDGQPRQLTDVGRQHADWRAAIAYARTLEGVDPERIALWGSSFSGGHVVEIAAGDPRVKAVVSQVPFTDGLAAIRAMGPVDNLRMTAAALRDQTAALFGRGPSYVPAVGPPGATAAMTAPEAEPGFAALNPPGSTWVNRCTPRVLLGLPFYRPFAKLAAVRARVLVAVAERDETTPPGPAIDAARAAPNAELVTYPLGHFEIYVGEAFERAVAAQAEFLARNLLGARETAGATSA